MQPKLIKVVRVTINIAHVFPIEWQDMLAWLAQCFRVFAWGLVMLAWVQRDLCLEELVLFVDRFFF